MNILLSGANGFLGKKLTSRLQKKGHEVIPLKRGKSWKGPFTWDIEGANIQFAETPVIDAVIHLAGESLVGKRWNEEQKRKIVDSRVLGTRLLMQHIATLKQPPKVVLSASAVGYYGDRGTDQVDETSVSGKGFLAETCELWEAESKVVLEAGIRLVNIRTGLVLDPEEGALAKMLPPFRLGLGGKLGSGEQFMSWIALEDWLGAVEFILRKEEIEGAVNLVSPQPVTNREFTKALADSLGRPAFLPVPKLVLQLAMGEVADQLLLSGCAVLPQKLLQNGFSFKHTDLNSALKELLG